MVLGLLFSFLFLLYFFFFGLGYDITVGGFDLNGSCSYTLLVFLSSFFPPAADG